MRKRIAELFNVPTAHELAQRELAEAERELLRAQTSADYAASLVRYNEARIARLRRTLAAQ